MLKWDSDDGRGHGGHIQGGDVLRKYEVNGGGSQPQCEGACGEKHYTSKFIWQYVTCVRERGDKV